MLVPDSHLILDACCILNFCASGHFLDILGSISSTCMVSESVKTKELLTLQRMEAEYLAGTHQFEAALQQGLLQITDFQSEQEQETFINYLFELRDDGESATLAIAAHRYWAIATDDRKAISFAQLEIPTIQIVSTLQAMKHWADQKEINVLTLKQALYQIQSIGKYVPRKQDPLYSWWARILQN